MAARAEPAHNDRMSATPSRIKLWLVARCLAIALAAIPDAAANAAASGCTFPAAGSGRVVAILDGRSIRLDDGRDVRLAGVEAVPSTGASATAALDALLTGHRVTLQSVTEKPDRYGRLSAMVFQDGNETSVQEMLLTGGHLLAAGTMSDPECSHSLAAFEAAARRARHGYWGDASALKNAEIPGDILAVMGQFAVVQGRVSSVRRAGATIYLNFGRRWTRDFAVTISRRLLRAFEAAGVKPMALEHRMIRVRGWVERRGGPRMQAFAPGQIETIADGGESGDLVPLTSSSQELPQQTPEASGTHRTP
jgi:endonuclease YncB( thermonuclease family)